MLTISQLADFAGVTVRAIRHYHARGLLAEPARDASGYRRYGADDAIVLIRIRTLAEAGVPLARVKELLASDADGFAAAVREVDAELGRRIRELREHRSQVRRLTTGDRLALPDEVVVYLEGLRAAGAGERVVGIERDGWLLLAAHSPDLVVQLVEQKAATLADPAWLELYVAFGNAYDWDPDDPRVVALAERLLAFVAQLPREEVEWAAGLEDDGLDEGIAALLASQSGVTSPAWERLGEVVQAGMAAALAEPAPAPDADTP